MPRTETILTVFVACPGDLQDEREQLKDIIDELNVTWSSTLGRRLEFMGWDTHATPGIGADPQDVINRAINDTYDIFVGMMWTRFGSPTGRAGSGTEEEFNRAYDRYQRDHSTVRVMFYFKDAPVPPSQLDAEQLGYVTSFRRRIGDEGTLYASFRDSSQFGTLLRTHLSRQVQEWGAAWGDPNTSINDWHAPAIPSRTSALLPLEEDDDGFLDLVEVGQGHFGRLTDSTQRIAESIEQMGNRVEERTPDVVGLDLAADPRGARRVIDRIAADMEDFVTRMETELPMFSESYAGGLDAFGRAAALLMDFTAQDDEALDASTAGARYLSETIQETHEKIGSLRDVIGQLPRASTSLKRARRRTLSVLDRLLGELETALQMTLQLVATFDDLRERFTRGTHGPAETLSAA